MKSKTIVAGALGNCVHVAGIVGFLRVAEQVGYETHFLGAAVSIDDFVEAVRKHDPEVVGVSFRLTPEVAGKLFQELRKKLDNAGLGNRKFVLGGTPPVCELGRWLEWFDHCFDGLEAPEDVWSYLKGESLGRKQVETADTLLAKVERKHPYPLLRHHFGLPTVDETVAGIKNITDSGVCDVISIAPDQNAQESFFRPKEMNPMLNGAGGVPVRRPDDLRRLYAVSRHDTFPLLRIYSGTRDLVQWAELAHMTIKNAWGAVPLCWYSALDGRSKRTPEDAIRENQDAMRWYAKHDVPLEVNEAHHWSMRDAHDTIAVAMAYIAAYNAKKVGVKHYIAQYMFNSPPATYGTMDLAKMLAKIELIESLHDSSFTTMRQVRAGLLHLSPHMNVAKGQLAASTELALLLKPHIIHVVGYSEGDHAATADDVIESCEIVHGVIRNCLFGMPDAAVDPIVQERKKELISEARALLEGIESLSEEYDALTDPKALAKAIKRGFLDAPHLKGNPHAAGILETRMINGAVLAVDSETKQPVKEIDRLKSLRGKAVGIENILEISA